MSRPRFAGRTRKRSITLAGHKTSLSLEPDYWDALRKLARDTGKTLVALVGEIDDARPPGASLSAAIRVEVLIRLREKLDTLSSVITDAFRPKEAEARA